MSDGLGHTPAVDAAVQRLEAAIDRLEGRLDGLSRAWTPIGRSSARPTHCAWTAPRLAVDLDAARSREKELQRLADEASEALGAAISEVREALGKV